MSKRPTIGKADLVNCMVECCKTYETKTDAAHAIDAFVKAIECCLEQGKDVSLVGFGKFEVRHRPERQGRNPQTGEPMTVKAANVPAFKAGAKLKEKVN